MADNAKSLTVSIVTPDGQVYENKTPMLIVGTIDGELGILPNHIPVIASLAIDEVRIKQLESDQEDDEIAVNGGFVEFSNNTATIVADSAERQNDIDVARAENARKRAETRIQNAQQKHDDAELARAQVALRRAMNRLNVARH
ncbi:F0F1 ATP synthase subunit epsilon [Lactiplantibacillus plantarum]|uniref:F0F1 ATP synthase subunit epsilon n=1 Tax=Lactiplantibacillus plantarum TaxID=1590 RepID=UPI00203E5B3A|nr:F0F1 ATP synthase subunit epsilon [Lactiplantibacillus plantarum]MCM2585402.1 F0F1 ATP synthase subunit epsilon [Lactiplantibacillus plantarum]MCM2599327.1 F0F1 ATP synthase subunit epsilon [Lactiplantibacillus plantarum]MCM2602489.1 F0F1 ATP synthase subunit epsilon [Lactiplantibacillus plantarum]MCM2609828.1 F0F1 ATP synthase subunit epsilon [Lactiplantibacillus plantarum]MCM2611643.1 F0F1 ATP synthase subunit epsilon [Lactiplantibacillus plantarum]